MSSAWISWRPLRAGLSIIFKNASLRDLGCGSLIGEHSPPHRNITCVGALTCIFVPSRSSANISTQLTFEATKDRIDYQAERPKGDSLSDLSWRQNSTIR